MTAINHRWMERENASHPLLPVQWANKRQGVEVPEAELCLAIINQAVLILLGNHHACEMARPRPIDLGYIHWSDADFDGIMFRDTWNWMFRENVDKGYTWASACSLDWCCSVVTFCYGHTLDPDWVRDMTRKRFDETFPDGKWKIHHQPRIRTTHRGKKHHVELAHY